MGKRDIPVFDIERRLVGTLSLSEESYEIMNRMRMKFILTPTMNEHHEMVEFWFQWEPRQPEVSKGPFIHQMKGR